jgi:hypothetical protein
MEYERIDSDRLDAAYRAEHDEDGLWELRECVICHSDTHLRCARCNACVCHLHDECPNGCDGDRYSGGWYQLGRRTPI